MNRVIVIVAIFSLVCFVSSAPGQQRSLQSEAFTRIQKFAPANECSSSEREELFQCEVKSADRWNVLDTDYYTSTRKFCCFVWDTLSCQLDIAQHCDPSYAASLDQLTEQSYSPMCADYGRWSASCAHP